MARDIDRMELPQWYDENTLTMLVVSPNTVFLYWELAFGQTRVLGDRRLVLRLYELSLEPGYENDNYLLVKNVELPPFTNDWYFQDLKPASRYRAEMGWESSGRFYSMIKSNIVEVPPASPATATRETRRLSADTTTVSKTASAAKPTRATVRELIDSMSFYMGIKKEDSPERK